VKRGNEFLVQYLSTIKREIT